MKTRETKKEGVRELIAQIRATGSGMLGIADELRTLAEPDRGAVWQDESLPPLMIRVDRLLFALDVLGFIVADYDREDDVPATTFSSHRCHAACRKLGVDFRDFLWYEDSELGVLHGFLSMNRKQLAELTIDAGVVISAVHDTGPAGVEATKKLLSAIASGELTEDDFKEDSHGK